MIFYKDGSPCGPTFVKNKDNNDYNDLNDNRRPASRQAEDSIGP